MELTGLLNAMDMIVPVPLHWTRRIKRGYNQAEVLAKACAKATGVYTRLRADLLARKRGTRTQTTLDRDSRRRNLSGAFVLKESHREQIANKRICIVDDVITTGATVGACANELIKAGALQVMALSLARA